MYKRLIALFMVVLVTAATFATAEAQAKKKIAFNSYSSDPQPRAFEEKLIKMWNDKNADQPVALNTVNHEDFKQAIRTYLVAEPAPDILTWFAGNRATFFVEKGLIADFSDVWQKEGWDKTYPAGFKALASYKDKQYFLPTNYYWWALYFRPSVLKANSLEAPKTWDDMIKTCDALNAKGITPIAIGTKGPWTAAAWFDYINMRLNGPEFHVNLMLLKEKYTDERVKNAFMKWKEMFDHKCFLKDSAALEWGDAVKPLAQGKAAMYLMGGFIQDTWKDLTTADKTIDANDLDFVRFPIIDAKVKIGEDAPTDGYFLAAKGANTAGAKSFLAWLGSKEVVQIGVDELKRLPVRNDIDTSKLTDAQKKGIGLIQSADYVAQFYDRDTTPEMAEKGLNAFAAFFADPTEKNIDALLKDLEETRDRLAKEQAAQ